MTPCSYQLHAPARAIDRALDLALALALARDIDLNRDHGRRTVGSWLEEEA